jgi:dihydropteroate synthase
MGVRAAGVLRLGGRRFEPWQLLVMAVAPGPSMEWVHAAVGEGADIVELPAPLVATARDAYPELVIGVRTGSGAVAREAGAAGADLLAGPMVGVAAELGVGVVGSLAGAGRAVEAGVAAERVVVASAWPVADVVASGWPVLVSLPDPDLARAAVFAWQGARVFRVDRVRETRRALRMVSAIRGDLPPAYAVRGLA